MLVYIVIVIFVHNADPDQLKITHTHSRMLSFTPRKKINK